MAGDQRDVEIAALADGLAIVHGLQNRQAARMFLHQARQGVEIARPRVIGERLPNRKRGASGLHGCADVGCGALSDGGERFAGGRIGRVEEFVLSGRVPFTGDKVADLAFVAIEPGERFARIFRRVAVLHRYEFFYDTHGFPFDHYFARPTKISP